MDGCLPPDLPHYAQHRAIGGRPELSGGSTRVEAGRFRVHFTQEGEDATDPEDEDGDSLPDAIPRLLGAFQEAEAFYLQQGWPALEADNGYGGSAAIDVYVRQIDANGYAYPAQAEDPDAVSSCFIEIHNDLTGAPGQLLESVAAHELHHCVQFTMTVDTHSWMYESTATYEQYQAITGDDLELLYGVLYQVRLSQPELPLNKTGDRYEYAGMLFAKYWVERGGFSTDRLVRLWEELRETPDWKDGVERAALREWGVPLEGAFTDYSAWNAFACARDDGQHYGDAVLPCQVDVAVPITERAAGEPFELSHGDGRFTAQYLSFPADGDERPMRARCNPLGEGMRLSLRLLSVDERGALLESAGGYAEAGAAPEATLAAPLDPKGEVLLLSASMGAEPADAECVVQRVEPPGGGCATAGGAGRGGAWALALGALGALRARRATRG